MSFFSEPHPILWKYSERWAKKKHACMSFFSEPHPILWKYSERWAKKNYACMSFFPNRRSFSSSSLYNKRADKKLFLQSFKTWNSAKQKSLPRQALLGDQERLLQLGRTAVLGRKIVLSCSEDSNALVGRSWNCKNNSTNATIRQLSIYPEYYLIYLHHPSTYSEITESL